MDAKIVAAITAALAAYGDNGLSIKSIKPVKEQESKVWTMAGRQWQAEGFRTVSLRRETWRK